MKRARTSTGGMRKSPPTPEEVEENARQKRLRGMGSIAPPLGPGERFDYLETRPTDEAVKAWGRPEPSKEMLLAIDGKTRDFVFQLVDCQAAYVNPQEQRGRPPIRWNGNAQVPVVRLYGVTPEGHSVCVNVWNFAPYLFLNTPDHQPHHKLDLETLERDLDKAIAKQKQSRRNNNYYGGGGREEGGFNDGGGYPPVEDIIGDSHSVSQTNYARAAAVERAAAQGIDPAAAEREYDIRAQMKAEEMRRSGSLWGGSSGGGSGDPYMIPYDKVAANRARLTSEGQRQRRQNQHVVSIEAVTYCIAEHYSDKAQPLLKVNLRTPNLVPILRDMVTPPRTAPKDAEGGVIETSQGCISGPTYESGVLFETRFLVDHAIAGSGYACVKGPFWKRRRFDEEKDTTCQIELDADTDELAGITVEQDPKLYSLPSKMRVLSRDTEMLSLTGDFPVPQKDPIIVIHTTLFEVDNMENPILRLGFCLGSLPLGKQRPGEHVICYETEKEMLDAYGMFVTISDPDLLSGYNTKGFDAPYLYDRAVVLGATAYLMSNRLCSKEMTKRTKMRQSKNLGNRTSFLCNTEGRVEIDVMQYIQDAPNYKLRSYSLNAVSAEFLNDQKDDVDHKMIPVLYRAGPQERMRLVDYCRKDADLPRRLMIQLKVLLNIFELCRVQGVQIKDQQDGNPTGRAFACFLPVFRSKGFVVPYRSNLEKRDYVGANVFEPERGFYRKPVVILDFASLYPSEMMAHNLCYTTHIPKDKVAETAAHLGGVDKIEVCPDGHAYVRAEVRRGILPIVLSRLIDARAAVKELLKTEADSRIIKTLTTREMAIKIVANSVYGFCGLYSNGTLWQEVAESTTAYGREQIKETRRITETAFVKSLDKQASEERAKLLAHVPPEKRAEYEAPGDAKVLYGDTDSVMVDFGITVDNWDSMDEVHYAVQQAQRLGNLAADLCTRAFAKPNKLQLECVIMPFLLINKKRYGGLIWNNPYQWSSMKLKGIESVRRDNCRHAARTQKQALKILFENMDPEAAIKYAADSIGKLRRNKVDMYDLIISGSLSKTEYKNPQAHAHVAELIKQRSPGSEPHIGDRVPYVIVSKDLKTKRFLKAEDPVYALENDLNLDTEYYVENQMMGPLKRIFEPIYGEEETNRRLRSDGDRIRIIKLGEEKSGLLKFYAPSQTCIRCGVALTDPKRGKGLLCHDCEPHRVEEVIDCTKELRQAQLEHSRLWTTCSTCQGTVTREVVCSNTDCSIFFKRTTVTRELSHLQERTKRLSLEW